MKMISKKDLVKKHEWNDPVYSDVESVSKHLITMQSLGFTNTGIYLAKEKTGLIIKALQDGGYRVFGEVNAYKDNLVQIEWF